MERHELEVEHIGLWGCERPSDTASSNMEARCADVQQVRICQHTIKTTKIIISQFVHTQQQQQQHSADEGFDGTYPTNVVVRSNGSCLYVPPGIFIILSLSHSLNKRK
jgi:hypothetical protein